jgi:hypothetical protein
VTFEQVLAEHYENGNYSGLGIWAQDNVPRLLQALRMIGYSAHTGLPRFGDKAQAARWGLGEDSLPENYAAIVYPLPSLGPCAECGEFGVDLDCTGADSRSVCDPCRDEAADPEVEETPGAFGPGRVWNPAVFREPEEEGYADHFRRLARGNPDLIRDMERGK